MISGFLDDCLAETGLAEETFAQVRSGNLPDDGTLKELIFCMNKKLGFQNEDGELQMEAMKAMFSKYNEPAILDKLMECIVQKDTPQNSAYEIAKCAKLVKFILS